MNEDNRLANVSRPGSAWSAIATGAAGAAAVTLAHEIVRQLVPGAPRMDRLGMSALSGVLRRTGIRIPASEKLRGYTLLGDVLGNALAYAPVAGGKRPLLRGLGTGVGLGLGAIFLTPALGLPRRHRGLNVRTKAITVALYAFGGLAAAAMASLLDRHTAAGARGATASAASAG